jgi:chromosome segregation ATPase
MTGNWDDLLLQLKEESGQLATRIHSVDRALTEMQEELAERREELRTLRERIRGLEDTHTRLSAKVDTLFRDAAHKQTIGE